MFKPIKLTVDPDNTFFASDFHHNHNPVHWPEPIWAQRGFASAKHCDDGLIALWNKRCNKDSIAFNLGDPVFGDPDGDKFFDLMRRLNFARHYILIGNHVSGHLQAYKKILREQFPALLDGNQILAEVYPLEYCVDGDPNKKVIFLPQYAEVELKGPSNTFRYVLCHYPMDSWNGMSDGVGMIHGHEHGSQERSKPECREYGKIVDVSVENLIALNAFPMSLNSLGRVVQRKQYVKVGHH